MHTVQAATLLNLGCGQRFHPAWTNLDVRPSDPTVRAWDVTKPLPFADGSFDAVYHSHLLEHLPRDRALPFLRECCRVQKPGGVIRIAIPDLEAIALLYLDAVAAAWNGDADALEQHRWLVMELYDQTTRESSGGEMLPYLGEEGCNLAWYRIGTDGTIIRKHLRSLTLPARPKLSWRERLLRWLLGDEYQLLEVGRFRKAAEVHHWMYDRVSLRELLTQAGFVNFRTVGPAESAIPDWSDYHLDTTPAGGACKPDSLYVEAERP